MITKVLRFIKFHLVKALRTTKKYIDEAKIQLYRTLHKLRNLITGKKPEHIIICGPARSGTTLMYNMVRYSIDDKDIHCPGSETPALESLSKFKKAYITKRPLDLYLVKEIQMRFADIRELKFLIMVRDPRALITSKHKSIPWQFNQSWDYGFYLGPHPSFTRLGVGKAFEQIDTIKRYSDIKYKIVRYEDLVADSENIRAQLSDFSKIPLNSSFSEFHEGKIPEKLTTQLNGIRPPEKKNAERWRDPKYKKRIDTQLLLFPEMKKRIIEYGYPLEKVSEESKLYEPEFKMGTVVAMHTPDNVYTNEAKRMTASLDRLGMQHSIDELPPVEEIAMVDNPEEYPAWFVQKLARYYKPTWLKQKREQLNGPILYCDVDAFFHKDPWPYLSLYDGDMAVFTRRNGIVNSASIWINDTVDALKILILWEERCQQKRKQIFDSWPNVAPSASDQVILKEIVQENNNDHRFNIQRLPPTMVHIFDEKNENISEGIYIEQLQASRVAKSKHKRTLNREMPTSRDNRISELEGLLLDD